MIKLNASHIAIITDIHWGLNQDNEIFLSVITNVIDEFIDYIKSKNINTIFFLGDWFHNRNNINVHTLNISYPYLEKLSQEFNLYFILGNHDVYFRHKTDINSIKPFNKLNGLHIIDTPTKIDINGVSALLCPWLFNIEEYKNQQFDLLFGHFDMSGAALMGTTYTKGKYHMKKLNDIAPLVFSGHFHINKHYEHKNGEVITVGSPFEQNWGERNNKKGFYILNIQKKKYEFVENNKSPIHYQYFWSKIKNKTQQLKKSIIENNFIKLIIDVEFKYDHIFKINDIIQDFNPLKLEIEYMFNNDNLINKEINDCISNNKSLKDYCIDCLEDIDSKKLKYININNVKKSIDYYYNKAKE